MEELIKLLKEINANIDYEKCSTLVEDNLLDSFDIFTLVSGIYDRFQVTIKPQYIVPENFNSAKDIYQLIETIKGE